MTAIRIFRAGALAVACPAMALAQGFDGDYEYAFCDTPPAVALSIDGPDMTFYETPCTLSNASPVTAPAGGVRYTMSCEHGGGPQVNEVLLYRNAEGDLILDLDGTEDRFVRCD